MVTSNDSKQTKSMPGKTICLGHVKSVCERSCKLSGVPLTQLRNVATPNLDDHSFTEDDFIAKGALAAEAAKIVLMALWPARMARPGLL